MKQGASETFRKLPAARGLVWIKGSWELFRRQPLRLLLISLFFQFLLGLSQASTLGMLVILCLPILSAGMLHAFFMVDCGAKPLLAVLFMPFTAKKSVGPLLLLGAFVMVLGLLIVTLVLAGQMVDLDPQVVSRIEQGDLDALQLIDPQILQSAVMAMALGAAISGCLTYFSVPLIWFKRQAMGIALLTGLKALGRNWKPLLFIGLLLAILTLPIALIFGSFYLAAQSGGMVSNLLAFLLLLLGPMFQVLLFGTQYLAFKDIFGMHEAVAEQGGRKADQLVA